MIWKSPAPKLFKIKLSDFVPKVDYLLTYLSEEEIARASRYHFKKDGDRFTICRAILKIILAQKIDLEVSKITIEKGENKKPFLSSHPSLYFNLSHSNDCALIAIGASPVGVDIERIDYDFDYHPILYATLNSHETGQLMKSKYPARTFYSFWTRKEAVVKATGLGISNDFRNILTVERAITDPNHSLTQGNRIKVLGFDLGNEYLGALALVDYVGSSENLEVFNIPLWMLP